MAIHPIMLSTLLADLVTHGEAETIKQHGLSEMLLVGTLPAEVSRAHAPTRAAMPRNTMALLEARLQLDMVAWPLGKKAWSFSNALKLGRDPSNDLVLAHPSVSKTHARFSLGSDGISVEDLKGGGATAVNGQAVAAGPFPLKDSDQVSVGEMNFLVISTARLMKVLGSD